MSNNGNIKNAFKAGIWYTVSTILVKSISIISTPLYTRMMTTADYGIAATFNTWYALLAIICSLNVGYSIGRAKIDFGERFEKYIGSLQVICAAVTIGIFSLIFVFFKPLHNIIGLNLQSVFWLFLYVLFGTVVSVNQGRYRFQYQYKQNIFISVFVSVGTILCSLTLIALLPEKYMGKIIGTAMPMILLGFYFWFTSGKQGKINFSKEFYTYALTFSVPLIVHSLSIYVLGQSDRLMIRYFCGDDAVGIYSLVYQYAILITLITNSVNEAWNPWFHDNYAMKNFSGIRKNIIPLVMLGCYIGIGCVGVAPEAVLLLGGKDYMGGLGAVLPIALGVVIQFVYTQYVIIEMHLKKTKFVSAATAVAAVINLILNYLFIPRFGFIAAAYTTLVSYIVLLAMHHFMARAMLHVHLYEDRKIYIIILITCVICTGLSMLTRFILLRYVFLVLLTAAFLFYQREFILTKLKRRK